MLFSAWNGVTSSTIVTSDGAVLDVDGGDLA